MKGWGGNLNEREIAEAAADLDLDIAFGQVLKKLDDLGISGNTYVIFTTDHGTPGRNPPLAGGKGTVSEGGLRVPLIIRGPGIQPGACSHVRAIGEDLFPTIAALAQVSVSRYRRGLRAAASCRFSPPPARAQCNALCYQDTEGCIAYGPEEGKLATQTPTRSFRQGEPVEIVLTPLQPNTRYFYQFRSARTNSAESAFHTARPPGSAFTFTVTADSHLDRNTAPAIYQRTLANALADAPGFHIDLGDTFMTEKHASRENAARQYLAQRFYFGRLCQSAPLFLVLGNHDGESPRGPGSDADGLAVWSNQMRKRYFPNPVPDNFYTGNATKHPEAGLLQDYYASECGDALFVVLDPFWFTQRQRGQNDNWKRTLGAEQYQWLKRTLEASQARFKFVFIHHLVGGLDAQCRGGSEAAPFYEWGGKNSDGTDGFKRNRPGWAAPIHQLLVQNKVNIVFHGHDHFCAKQDLDGIVYQEVPQPGYPGNGRPPRSAAEYGYVNGTILGSSGHLRMTVSPQTTTVAYLQSDATTNRGASPQGGRVIHTYSLGRYAPR